MNRHKIGRNDKCPCGSGSKYKKCHYPETNFPKPSAVIESNTQENIERMKSLYSTPELRTKILERAIKIEEDKLSGNRALPHDNSILGDSIIPTEIQEELLDIVAIIVDQNQFGRSDMCMQFAVLLSEALKEMGHDAEVATGRGVYNSSTDPSEKFEWDHSWVELGDEIIDGNVDSLPENPAVGFDTSIKPTSFWGAKSDLPIDRKLIKKDTLSYEDLKLRDPDLERWRGQLFEILTKRGRI